MRSFFPSGDRRVREVSSASAPRTGAVSLFDGTAPSALQIATVYRCCQIISNNVASLPLRRLRRAADGTFSEDRSGRLSYLLRVQPDDRYNAFDFWDQAVRQMLLLGEAFIVPVWSETLRGDFDRLVLCSPNSVSYDTISGIYTVSDYVNGLFGTYLEDEIVHLKNLSLDGVRGVSVLTFARQTMNIAGAGDTETLNRFVNGGNIRGFVTNDTSVRGFGEYQDSELSKTAVNLDERFRSGERIVSLPGQAKFDQISLSSVDMEFLNTRKFSVREICRYFGVPPTFAFDDSASNYKSAEMANLAFLSQTLNPILVKIEQELLRKLESVSGAGVYRYEFDRRALYATDLLSKADYQTRTIASGVYTINDWRRFENNPPVSGGDRPLVSANLKSLDDILNPAKSDSNAKE